MIRKKARIISDDDMTIGANPSFLGTIRMATGGDVFIDSDLRVDGSISGQMITSQGRVDAGTGVSAGPLGFVSVLGGLSIGAPVAAPGTIVAVGPAFCSSINAFVANFGLSSSLWAFDQVNTPIYNTHFHPAPRGITGPPISQQIGLFI